MTTSKPVNQVNLRNIVMEMLLKVNKGEKSHVALKSTLDKNVSLDKHQRSFITRLFQGTLERRIELDFIINQFSKTPVNKMKPVIREILRMGVYQIKYMDNVPVSAVCNEGVKLAEKRKFRNLKGFVNGVLRNVARNIEKIEYPKEQKERLSVIYSVPKWIIEKWTKEYGISKTEEMLEGLYKPKATSVRCNTSKATVEEIVKSLEYQGTTVEKSKLYDKALKISGYDKLENLDVFKAGMVTVQDESSMMVGIAANPKEKDYIIDVCAAPGGKSLHVSELLNGTGTVEARDLTEYKIGLIEENIARVGNENIITKVSDATVLDKEAIEKADIVIADLPCSGLGVIGNKSDIKYNITQNQIDELVELQRKILKQISKYVKQGGKLLYSTCTVNRQENDSNVKWIQDNLPFKLQSLNGIVPEQLKCEKGCLQIYPGQYGMDGFFVSLFIRE